MRKFSLIVLAALIAPQLWAGPPAPKKPTAYFNPATFNVRLFLKPPAPDQSGTTEKEMETILQRQADRTAPQLAQIQSEEHYSVFAFGGTTGWLSKGSIDGLPQTTALLARMMETVKPIISTAKDDFNRPHPYQLNARIFPPIDRPTDSSYPSSHGTRAMLDAYVLAELAPDQAKSIVQRGQEIGDDRVTAGVEYPSDVAAGQKLAQAVFERLAGDPQFMADLKAARAEVAAARKKGL